MSSNSLEYALNNLADAIDELTNVLQEEGEFSIRLHAISLADLFS